MAIFGVSLSKSTLPNLLKGKKSCYLTTVQKLLHKKEGWGRAIFQSGLKVEVAKRGRTLEIGAMQPRHDFIAS